MRTTWSRANVGRALRHLWGTLKSLSGVLDVLGTVLVGFFLDRIPGLAKVAEQPWFTPVVITVGAVVFVFFTALRATAEIEILESRERERQSERATRIVALQGDLNRIINDLRDAYDRKREAVIQGVTARVETWQGFEAVVPAIEDVNKGLEALAAVSDFYDAIEKKFRNLRDRCVKAIEALERIKR